ncbi:MAG: hypothetical protein ACYCSP_14945 [Acidobacteriaceae bacterium]
MAHAIQWFWTVGRHCPAWVQAETNLALLLLSALTLLVLFFYARDNHRLAANSEFTLMFLKNQEEHAIMGDYAAAYDTFYAVQGSLTSLLRTVVNGTFSTRKPPPMFPANWPQLTVPIALRATSATDGWVQLGVSLRKLDFETADYFAAATEEERRERLVDFRKALDNAIDDAKQLANVLRGYEQAR